MQNLLQKLLFYIQIKFNVSKTVTFLHLNVVISTRSSEQVKQNTVYFCLKKSVFNLH